MQLLNGSVWPWRWTEKQDWRKATAQLMLALIECVVDAGVFVVPQTHSEKLATMIIVQT